MRNHVIYICVLFFLGMAGCKKENKWFSGKITPDNFLSDKTYDKLIVEIQYVKGFEPAAATVNNLKAFLEQRLNKPEGITILQSEIESPGRSVYTVDDVRAVEKNNRVHVTKGKTLTSYLFFADGEYAGNNGSSKVLGIAYGGSSMVIFESTIQNFSGGITQPPRATLETTVTEHEFGHVLGLVNNGTPMQSSHQDEPHGKHCSNANCLMYYTAETSDIVANIIGGNVPVLDNKCLEDLRANGGK